MQPAPIPRYGVHRQQAADDAAGRAMESLRLLGYAVVDGRFDETTLTDLRHRFAAAQAASLARYGAADLRAIDEHNTIRCMLAGDPAFLQLAMHPVILDIAEQMLGPGFILNQQNGIINPGDGTPYSQAFYHRDLPYQHFISSRPLALNAVFCVDDFTPDNGATLVVPASHKEEAFPSDNLVHASERVVTASAGSFIVLDCMTFHRGGRNESGQDRRAVNHVYTIGLMRQQVDLPAFLGDDFSHDPIVRRLLGFDYGAPRSPAEYYAQRRRKLS